MSSQLDRSRKGFVRGSSTFRCQHCERTTRATGRGDNENSRLCAECYDLGGESNSLQDNGALYSVAGARASLLALVVKGVNARELFPEVAAELDRLEAAAAPTLEQLLALRDWLTAYGRSGWKARLLTAWEVSGRGYGAYGPALQQLRNGFGPSWLAKMTEGKLSAAITKLAPPPAPPAISGAVLETEVELPAAVTPARSKFEVLIRAALELLDEKTLTQEQRTLAESIYETCNSLEYTFEPAPPEAAAGWISIEQADELLALISQCRNPADSRALVLGRCGVGGVDEIQQSDYAGAVAFVRQLKGE